MIRCFALFQVNALLETTATTDRSTLKWKPQITMRIVPTRNKNESPLYIRSPIHTTDDRCCCCCFSCWSSACHVWSMISCNRFGNESRSRVDCCCVPACKVAEYNTLLIVKKKSRYSRFRSIIVPKIDTKSNQPTKGRTSSETYK